MKSQDIGLLLKLVCLQKREIDQYGDLAQRYSVRALAQETGISKSQVSLALQRCFKVGLAKRERKLGVPRTNTKGLFEFIVYGIRYVFPAEPGKYLETCGLKSQKSTPGFPRPLEG